MMLSGLFLNATAQVDSLKLIKEINEQVWKPFITTFTSGDDNGFKALHSSRITRVEIDRGTVKDFDQYFPSRSGPRRQHQRREFELRFDQRICNGNKAWETGYYKGTVTPEGKPAFSYYGRFFVVLEKENGLWKIVVDADTGKDANEFTFLKASAME